MLGLDFSAVMGYGALGSVVSVLFLRKSIYLAVFKDPASDGSLEFCAGNVVLGLLTFEETNGSLACLTISVWIENFFEWVKVGGSGSSPNGKSYSNFYVNSTSIKSSIVFCCSECPKSCSFALVPKA